MTGITWETPGRGSLRAENSKSEFSQIWGQRAGKPDATAVPEHGFREKREFKGFFKSRLNLSIAASNRFPAPEFHGAIGELVSVNPL